MGTVPHAHGMVHRQPIQTCVGSNTEREKPPCFVNRNTKPAKVLHPLMARDDNWEASFHWEKGLLGDGVRKGGT